MNSNGEMSDEAFLRYCETHSQTQRAGFVPQNILRLLRLAGYAEDSDPIKTWEAQDSHRIVSLYNDQIQPYVDAARKRLAEQGESA